MLPCFFFLFDPFFVLGLDAVGDRVIGGLKGDLRKIVVEVKKNIVLFLLFSFLIDIRKTRAYQYL